MDYSVVQTGYYCVSKVCTLIDPLWVLDYIEVWVFMGIIYAPPVTVKGFC